MSRRAVAAIAAAVLLAAVVVLLFVVVRGRREPGLPALQLVFPAMGTVAELTLYGDPELCERAGRAVREEFERVEQHFSRFRPDSELSRLNAEAAARPFVCSEELWQLLTVAREAARVSEGAFDISATPLTELWGFSRRRAQPRLPTAEELAAARARVGLEQVEFDEENRTVRFRTPGMAFDFGGFAKGYAVDRAAEVCLRLGVRRGLINLGGNLRALPEPPPGRAAYRIAIRDPERPGGVLPGRELLDSAAATSGDYERFVEIDGVRYGHIMDPAAGRPASGGVAVTVFAPRALEADLWSTILYLKGESFLERARNSCPGLEAVFVRRREQP